MMITMVQEETRKGPWTEQEDLQLAYFVHLFGERRWDFIAKVSGLKRTGKSCRLRWVNYLNPGLKRGRMTPQEERMVLELHSRWGNRWSRIAQKLPGRTDNEIKNYWRTHMRKKAQQRKQGSPSSSNYLPGSSSSVESNQSDEGESLNENLDSGYNMDEIWKEIASSEEVNGEKNYEGRNEDQPNKSFSCLPMASPLWMDCNFSDVRIDELKRNLLDVAVELEGARITAEDDKRRNGETSKVWFSS
ncbi:hypothetical protein Syun_015949 [Stephania yunnanensis]|uniref:Uncharacterized protein n=1 Tax=Stephania yunnanensis TaxID=152371 RepID=A0AAP0J3W3_9MAGN